MKQKYFRRADGRGYFFYVEKKENQRTGIKKEIEATPLKWVREHNKIVIEKEIKSEFKENFYEVTKEVAPFEYEYEAPEEDTESEGIDYEDGEGEDYEEPGDRGGAGAGEPEIFWEKGINKFQDLYDTWGGKVIYGGVEYENVKDFWRHYLVTRGNEDKNLQGAFVSDNFHTSIDSISDVMIIDFIEEESTT